MIQQRIKKPKLIVEKQMEKLKQKYDETKIIGEKQIEKLKQKYDETKLRIKTEPKLIVKKQMEKFKQKYDEEEFKAIGFIDKKIISQQKKLSKWRVKVSEKLNKMNCQKVRDVVDRLFVYSINSVIVIDQNIGNLTEEKWRDLLSKKDKQECLMKNRDRIILSLRKGIPNHLYISQSFNQYFNRRPEIWCFISDVEGLKRKYSQISFKKLCQMNATKQNDDIIKKDLARTYPQTNFNKGENSNNQTILYQVLKAYSIFDAEVGYTQGMNLIAGAIIMYLMERDEEQGFQMINTESDFENIAENSFWILCHVMFKQKQRDVLKVGLPGLFVNIDKFHQELKIQLPLIYDHLENNDVIFPFSSSSQLYLKLLGFTFSQYFITLLLYNTPLEFCRRILDLYLILGEDAIIQLLLALLRESKQDILKTNEFEVLIYLTKDLMKNYLKKFPSKKWEIPLPYFDITSIQQNV